MKENNSKPKPQLSLFPNATCQVCGVKPEHYSGLLYRFGIWSECGDIWFDKMCKVLKEINKKGYYCRRCGLFADWKHPNTQLCDLCYAAVTMSKKDKPKEKKVKMNLNKWINQN